ncbi:MAG: hypothetical protein ABL879_11130 [Devosia sp.]
MKSADAAHDTLAALASQLRTQHSDYPAGRYDGRGIVIAAGGARIFTNAYVLLRVLRNTLHSTLPIEVWHFGAAELSPLMRSLLRELDVDVIDAEPILRREGATASDGWQLKPFSILHSKFAEVLLLDADQVPVTDPAIVFDWPQYRDTGAVFWPDIVRLRAGNPIWERMGLAPHARPSLESGQVLVDKRRHWRALNATVTLNQHADELYKIIYGDKDTFLLAWQLVGAAFSQIPHQPFSNERVLFQRDFDGKLIFQHRTNAKWEYSAEPDVVEGFQHFEPCRDALEDLRRRWNGRIFNPPDRTAAARAREEALAGARFAIEMVADSYRPIVTLAPHGEFREGRDFDRQNWWCEERGGQIVLSFNDGARLTYTFTERPDGAWSGHRPRHPAATVNLLPVLNEQPAPAAAPGLVDALLATTLADAGDRERLAAALEMLGRADPGMRRRIETLAGLAAHKHADILGRVIATFNGGPSFGPVVVDEAVMRLGYERVRDNRDG